MAVLTALGMSVSLSTIAQDHARPRRIAYLSTVMAEADLERFGEFRKALRGYGYVEGVNLTIDYRAEGDPGRLASLASELIRLVPDVIVTVATPATLAARNASRSIPIVFSGVGDPVAFGVVDSLRRPGGNVTGIANIVTDLVGKRLELIKQVVPAIASVAIPLEAHTPVSVLQWKESQLPARELKLRLHAMQITGPDSYEVALAQAMKAGVGAVAFSLSPMASTNAARIVELAARYRLPAIYARTHFVELGGLMSYGASFAADGRVMARLVDKVFKGTRPQDLPVEQPTEFELVINLKAARQLGLTIPQAVLVRADRVIE